MNENNWRNCIVCKKGINYSTKYYKCSVSSCDKKRAPAQFCSVDCWDVHRSIMNHRSAGAEEYQSPTKEAWLAVQANEPKVRHVSANSNSQERTQLSEANNEEILVVVSKLKNYVKERSGLNTSSDVMPELSRIIRETCDKAIENANKSERKTLMARDF